MGVVVTRLFPRDIITITARVSGVPVDVLTGPSKRAEHVDARHAAMMALRRRFGLSTLRIGRMFKRDHGTVAAALRKADHPFIAPILADIEAHIAAMEAGQ